MDDDVDPFEAFASKVKQAANIEAEGGTPLVDGQANTGVAGNLSLEKITSIDDVADVYLRAEAQAKAARMMKAAAKEFIKATSIAQAKDTIVGKVFEITVDREEQFELLPEKVEEAVSAGKNVPSIIPQRYHLTPAQIKKMTPADFALLAPFIRAKEDKVEVTVKRI